ncbi:hypothetical protein [Methylophaga sp.]|uniref:hypothetical protein n=1 Tax=Methylophaga sp. TaxID=2024840 RepID=UPI0025D77D11|nr:hypothetical protein [Methylophaga sp.]|tara:strand:- start:2162 stop:2335 length:174 start_codon:yes stop_codon:yes gene_type:complete
MELEKYIKEIGKLMPIAINLLTDLEASSSKYNFSRGSEEYPTTFKELFKKLRLWRKK